MSLISHLGGCPDIRGLQLGNAGSEAFVWVVEQILTGVRSRLDIIGDHADPGSWETHLRDRSLGQARERVVLQNTGSLDWLAERRLNGPREQYDFVLVDGNQPANDLLAQLALGWQQVRRGGLLFCLPSASDECQMPSRVASDAFSRCQHDLIHLATSGAIVFRKKVGVEAIVLSIDYGDYLKHTLPMLVRWVDRVLVVSNETDEAVADIIARVPFVELHRTNAFTKRAGDRFNRGAAINAGIDCLERSGWVLSIDADIAITQPILPPARTDRLYGALRKRVQSSEELSGIVQGEQFAVPVIPPAILRDGYAPSGYFQLWHWPTHPRRMPESSGDASRSDIEFARQWKAADRCLLDDFEVLHLESPDAYRGANWGGRVTARFESRASRGVPEKLADLEPLCEDRETQESVVAQQGVLTAANSQYWPTLRLLAEATCEASYPLAVVDHGLTEKQLGWLAQQGVHVHSVSHPERCTLPVRGRQSIEPPSAPQAWLKPWLCLHSPFEHTVWMDADAVPLRGLDRMFTFLDRYPWLTLESWTASRVSRRMYSPLIVAALGKIPPSFENAHRINTGVFGFRRGDAWVRMWWSMCQKILNDDQLLRICRLRDQAALVTLLCAAWADAELPRIQLDRGLNWPANGIRSSNRYERRQYPWQDRDLLETLRADHPKTSVIHWLGTPKPWHRPRSNHSISRISMNQKL